MGLRIIRRDSRGPTSSSTIRMVPLLAIFYSLVRNSTALYTRWEAIQTNYYLLFDNWGKNFSFPRIPPKDYFKEKMK
jgi:hypothetical protein